MARPFRVGVGGPVGSGKTALVERLTPMLIAQGFSPAIVANDVFTKEDERILRRGLAGILDESKIVGVETGTWPHTAVREDQTANLAAIDDLVRAYPETDVILVESGGDNLTLTFSPLLADRSIYVMDVSGGDKMPRKQGPGMIQADLLVINKADLAPYVGASLEVMDRDARALQTGPLVFTDCRAGRGLDVVLDWLVGELHSAAGRTEGTGFLGRLSAGPLTMASAEFVWREDGRPDWGGMWQDFCGLALFGGPPHRSEQNTLRPSIYAVQPVEPFDVLEEIRRGVLETTGLSSEPAEAGWVAVECESPRMAAWMATSIILENVDARSDGPRLLVPASPAFTLQDEVKSVITVVAKVHHYWKMAVLAR